MATSSQCPKCGFSNQPGYAFCSNCGSPLAVGPATPGASPAYPSSYGGLPMPAYTYGASPWAYERTKQIDRTKTGVLLLLIGTLLSWIPYFISLIGYLLLLVGAILLILGRKAFEPTHARNVIVSIVMFFVGIAVAIVVILIAVFSALSGLIAPGGVPNPAALASALNAALIVGIAEVLFTYALQNQTGRILLWAACGANLALGIAIFVIISPLMSSILTQADYVGS